MKTGQLDSGAILAKYPEQKPVCVNYVEMRGDISALHEENQRLQKRLAYFEEGLNPDAAAEFAARADSLMKSMDNFADNLLVKERAKAETVNEISQFLQNAGFEDASKALGGHYNL